MLKKILKKIIENPDQIIVKANKGKQAVFCIDADISRLENHPSLFFPGGDLGVFEIFFKSAQEYGFEIDKNVFFDSYKKIFSPNLYLHKDKNSCFCFKKTSLKDKSMIYEEKFLTKYFCLSQAIKTPVLKNSFICVFIIEGGFLVKKDIRLENGDVVHCLVFNQTLFFQKIMSVLNLVYKKKGIKTYYNQDKEFIREALYETTDSLFWDKIAPSFKGLPIRGLVIKDARLKKVKDLGIITV